MDSLNLPGEVIISSLDRRPSLSTSMVWNSFFTSSIPENHRRRINTEENEKVVAASWGTKLLKFLATLAILHQNNINNRLICTTHQDEFRGCKSASSSTRPSAKQLAGQGLEYILSPKQQRRLLPFLLYLSFF